MAKATIVEAKVTRGRGKGKRILRHIEIHHAENGGHIVRHHFEHGPGEYNEPEEHAFGKGEGHDMLAHVANVMGVPGPAENEEANSPANEQETAEEQEENE